jgi:YbbR domain-containing protein
MRLSFITENLSLKLFSLAVAILLFLFVSVESATPIDVDFRIEYRAADDMTIVGDAPAVLHTTLQGPWATFRSFEIDKLRPVVVDLTSAGPGTMRYSLDTNDVDPPGGMSVVAIRPSEVELTLDRKVERQLPVQVDIVGRPAFGFELGSVEATPRRVRVTGPVTVMQNVDFIYTQPLNVEGHQDDLATELDLRPSLAQLRIKDRRVHVVARINEEFVTRDFENVPVQATEAPIGTRLTPDRIPLRLKGPRNLVDHVDPKALSVSIDLEPELDEGVPTFEKTVRLQGNPDRTEWVGAPAKVQVQIPRTKLHKGKSAPGKN